MNVEIRCSVCRKRWPYAGSNPIASLDEHQAKEHPERDTSARPHEPKEPHDAESAEAR